MTHVYQTPPAHLGWHYVGHEAPSPDSLERARRIMLSHVDAQHDHDAGRLTALEVQLADLGWEMPADLATLVSDKCRADQVRSDAAAAKWGGKVPSIGRMIGAAELARLESEKRAHAERVRLQAVEIARKERP